MLNAIQRRANLQVQRAIARDAGQLGARRAARTAASGSYEGAVKRIERLIANEKARQAVSSRAEVRLQANAESLFVHRPDAKGTVVLFHGFTAGPWQYKELAERLHKEGYNVYAPRMPGHGHMFPDGRITGRHFVSAAERERYDTFARARYMEAAALGKPVWVGGLSGGANVALRTAEMFPEVKGVFDMAPFLGADGAMKWFYKAMAGLDKATFGLFGRLLDKIPKGKNGLASASNPMPHNQPSLGAALAIRDTGVKVKDVKAPIQFVTTEGDGLSGEGFVRKYFERTGGARDNGWYHFEKEAGVPHAMISPKQNKAPGAVDQLHELLVRFLETGKPVMKPPRT